MKIEIWIPAHNEENTIMRTVESVRQVISENGNINLGVACNGCTDKTLLLAQQSSLTTVDWPAIGKWQTLKRLIMSSESDWIGFVDAGTVWSNDVLNPQTLAQFEDPNIIGFTLEYAPKNIGRLEKIYWCYESAMKSLEQSAGGLIIMSGFTMFFRVKEVKTAIQFLEKTFGDIKWLNDDVVFPVTLRFLFPEKSIHLIKVTNKEGSSQEDLGLYQAANENRRRIRLMRGNLQWIRRLLPLFFKLEFLSLDRLKVLFLVSRILTKVFWAYFFLLFNVVCLIIIGPWVVILYLPFFVAPQFAKKFSAAFVASLRAAWELAQPESTEKIW